ncbi:MAG: sigma 54-interacting transcriptional regulator [Ignavibacteriaceae bacterium]|nr:sigma 54-interacting transcriptional regulator [Ignavibacteriaceae bacterium]
MKTPTINISVYSSEDTSSIISALDQINLDNYTIHYNFPDSFSVNQDEIVIVQEGNIDSIIYKNLAEKKEQIKNKIIFIINEKDALLASSIIKWGYSDFFVFPYEYFKMIAYLQEIILNNSYLTSKTSSPESIENPSLDSILGNSTEILKIIELSKKIADKKDINILILGETGTGKGLLAKAIHRYAFGDASPFVDIICTSIPETLLESELFGYEPGAFTNAKNKKQGLFELANHGTLFLDEIGDLSNTIQSKLLRTIENKIIRRLGGLKDIPISARIISATSKDLKIQMENNLFRRDLFHRLNTVTIELPSLKDRGDDILILADHFITHFNKIFNKNVSKITPDLKDFLLKYSWPGNIRQFRNSIERAVLLSEENILGLNHFSYLYNHLPKREIDDNLPPQYVKLNFEYEKVDLKNVNRLYAVEVLKKMHGNKSKTAKILGISRPKLDILLKLKIN